MKNFLMPFYYALPYKIRSTLLSNYIKFRITISPVIIFKVEPSSYSAGKISAGDLHQEGYLLKTSEWNLYRSGATHNVWWESLVNGKILIGDELLSKRGDETKKVEVDFN